MKWEDIDLNNRIIIVRNSKNNESRLIPMNDIVYRRLKNLSALLKKIQKYGTEAKIGKFKISTKT